MSDGKPIHDGGDVQVEMKRCNRCKSEKVIDDFCFLKTSHDGRQPRCRKCCSEVDAAYRDKNKETIRQIGAEYRKKNKDSIKEKAKQRYPLRRKKRSEDGKAYYAKNREKIKAIAKEYKKANPEIHKAWLKKNKERVKRKADDWLVKNKERRARKRREGRDKNKEKNRAYEKAYRAANLEKIKARHAKYNASHPEVSSRAHAKRRTFELNSPVGDVTAIGKWEKSWRTKKRVTCHWCGKSFPPKSCHADHVIPLSKGGAHAVENLCIACISCNLQKHAKMPEEFNKELEQPLLFW